MMCARKTNAECVAWSRRYRTALRRFLRQGPSASSTPADRLGRQAARLGLETLDVARVHEQALDTVTPPQDPPGNAGRERLARADSFFKETLVPIEATHRAARKADIRIDRLTRTLQRRTAQSSAWDEQLQQAIARRETAEAGAEERAVRHADLLAEARGIQKRLRDQMRGILSQQEGNRKRLGGELRDEVAQALLAIDLHLLALNTSGRIDTEKAEKSIAAAQQIVEELSTRGRLSVEPET